MTKHHEYYMRYAINLAWRHRGKTGDNPSVGCVIVKDGVIIGTGTTALTGRPHAEIEALNMAGFDKACGATAYVTLEPCAHVGKTQSCAATFIDVGIKECHVAIIDPDPRTAGKGVKMLKNAGIHVTVGILAEKAKECHADFLLSQSDRRPFITLKSAISLDGKINYGDSSGLKQITSDAAHRQAHLLRSQHRAIAVGVGTIIEDNPALTCRLNGLERFSPDIIIFDRNLRTPDDSKIFEHTHIRKIFIHSPNSQKQFLSKSDVFSISSAQDLLSILHDIAAMGINSLLVEGGAKLVTSFLQANIWDHYAHFDAPFIIGGQGLSMVGDLENIVNMRSFNHKVNNMTLFKNIS